MSNTDRPVVSCAICGEEIELFTGIGVVMSGVTVAACEACKPRVQAALDVVREASVRATRSVIKKRAPGFFKMTSMYLKFLRERETGGTR